ncbi:MAG TPA: M20/M25/M40 family metallo-hydrolase, partial [Alphaproteobacteria bacterium]|nr:M20/M25/M40 family metallo-hydrolase [Alphaproteobacteria bacterium]
MTPLAADFRRAVIERAVQRRRYLHANPQIAYEETNASALVQETLAGLGLSYTVIETQNPKTGEMARTGVIVDIQGQPCPDGRMMLIRGDMDALPMTFEKSGLPHASTNEGVMHACGHDGHTAMLLATAEVLAAG